MKRAIAIVAAAVLVVGLFFGTSVMAKSTLHVDDDVGADYTTISEALDDAKNGDTIIVHEGEYSDNVDVSKKVTIMGAEEEEMPTVDGGEEPAFVFTANRATLKGIGVRSSGDVIVVEANRVTLRCNQINHLDGEESGGIVVYSAHCLIQENMIEGHGDDGILLDNGAHHNQIADNEIENFLTGINLEPGCHHNNIEANGVFDTVVGISIANCNKNLVFENTIEDQGEYAISLGDGSSKNTIKWNKIFGSWMQGISLYGECQDNLIVENIMGFPQSAVFEESAINVECSSDNEIIGNIVTGDCGRDGILVIGCCEDELSADNNLIEGNTVDINGQSGICDEGNDSIITGNFVTGYLEEGDWVGIIVNEGNQAIGNNVVGVGEYENTIGIVACDFSTVLHNDISGCRQAIAVDEGGNSYIAENIIHSNWERGIWLEKSVENTVENNILSNNGTGILLEGATNNEILGNTVCNSSCNGIETREHPEGPTDAENNIIQNNTIMFNGDGDTCFDLFDDDYPPLEDVDNIWEPNLFDTFNFEEED